MSFISTKPEAEATGSVAELYREAKAAFGFIPNLTKVFSHRPEVYRAFQALLESGKAGMDARRYELVTLAAAQATHCSYCSLAHGSVLLRDHYGAEDLQRIATDYATADLGEADQAIMAYARKLAIDASAITEADIQALQDAGLSDTEIFDVTTAAAVRCFFTKTLDALGTRPDSKFNELPQSLRDVLTVGRPIDVV